MLFVGMEGEVGMNIEIANRLVNLRKSNGLSQEALAEKLGISRQAVSKWERAEASPDTDNLIMLARLYRVSLDELLWTEEEIPLPEVSGKATVSGNRTEAVSDGSMAEVVDGGSIVHVKADESMLGAADSSSMTYAKADESTTGAVDSSSVAYVKADGSITGAVDSNGMAHVNDVGSMSKSGTNGSIEYMEIDGNIVEMETGSNKIYAAAGNRMDSVQDIRGGNDSSKHMENDWTKEEKQEEYVHVGLGGVHVKDKDGSEVHVGWDGIHVDDSKKGDNVHIDKNGVYVNGEKYDRERLAAYYSLPFPLLIVILYILAGVFFGAWHPAWLLFLLIPLWYSFLEAVKHRNPIIFAYPVLAALLFLCVGIFFGAWHPGWVIFLTVPIYYPMVTFLTGKSD